MKQKTAPCTDEPKTQETAKLNSKDIDLKLTIREYTILALLSGTHESFFEGKGQRDKVEG